MKKLLLPVALLFMCYAVFFGYIAATYGSLPPRVASHFGIDGRANGWMSREGLLEFILGFGILVPAFVVESMSIVGWLPVSFVNLPNRDYWLAPERRRETSAVMLQYSFWLASLCVLLMTGLQFLVVKANTIYHGAHTDGAETLWLLGGFLAGMVIWIVVFKRRFRR